MMTSTSTIRVADLFTAADRCDRCSARASTLALLHSGGQLLFCGHHTRAHHAALELVAVCVDDWVEEPFDPFSQPDAA